MLKQSEIESSLNGFSKLNYIQRLEKLKQIGVITSDDISFLVNGGVSDISLGEHFIENAIGYFQLPLGVATQFKINKKDYLIPMAVEETSIIAAASKTAKWIKDNGQISGQICGSTIIGQIQIAKIKNVEKLKRYLEFEKERLIKLANEQVVPSLVQRGGGVTDIALRVLRRPDGFEMAVIHVFMNPCEAMGANLINQVCEFLKNPIQDSVGEDVTMCILSNLVDSKITTVKVEIDIDSEIGEKIHEASLFSQIDPYRAATNNKGIMNGIDPVLIATGNDWRAVEAGAHSYAARKGSYSSLSIWDYRNGILTGTLELPLIVGTVGGVTRLHPTSRLALQILNIEDSNELSIVCASAGLVQNLGALRALTTVGIIEGHMKLHIKNLSLGAGATELEMPVLQSRLEKILTLQKRITLTHAIEALREIRVSGH